MTQQTLHVRILTPLLKSDETFIENIVTFKNLLGTQPDYWKPRNDGYRNLAIPFAHLVSDLLIEWSGRVGRRATLRELLGILNQMKCRNLAEHIKQKLNNVDVQTQITGIVEVVLPAPVAALEDSIHIQPFNVDPPIPRFFGRAKELEELKQYFLDRHNEFAWTTIAVLGLGGIGKTQLVKKFLEDPVVSGANISWFSAETQEDLRKSISDFAETLDLEFILTHSAELIKQIVLKLGNYRPWLVVLDNVDSNYELVQTVGKAMHSMKNTFVIVTTRVRKVFAEFAADMNVQELDCKDAANLVKFNIGKSFDLRDEEVLDKLCHTLQHHPLALNQASALIKKRRTGYDCSYGIPEYLVEFEKCSKKLLSSSLKVDPYQKTIFVTWDVSINAIRTNPKDTEFSWQALKILDIFAFVHPERVSVGDLEKFYDFTALSSFPKFSARSIQILKVYSLVMDDKNHCWSIHRLVQEVTRIKLKEQTNLKLQGQLVPNVYSEILDRLLFGYSNAKIVHCSDALHLTRIWQYAVKDSQKHVTHYFLVPERIFSMLSESKLYKEAHEFSIAYHKQTLLAYGELHRATLHAEWRWAISLALLGKNEEAVAALENIIEKTIKQNNVVDCTVLFLKNSLANMLHEHQRYSISLHLLSNTVETCRNTLGPNHAYTNLFEWKLRKSVLLASEEDPTELFEDEEELDKNFRILASPAVLRVGNSVKAFHSAEFTLSLENTAKTQMQMDWRQNESVTQVTLSYIEARKLVHEGKYTRGLEILNNVILAQPTVEEVGPIIAECSRLRASILAN